MTSRAPVRRLLASVVAVATGATLVGLLSAPAAAVQAPHDRVVGANPANFTPNVMNGSVKAIAQVDSQIVIGGDFTQVQAAGSTTTLTRNNILAFNATTGAISTAFVPALNGAVEALVAAPDGQSVYVGGRFSTVNGVSQSRVARLSISNGQRVAGFGSVTFNGIVRDLRLHPNGNLIVGGPFTTVGGQPRTTLASLNATTGAVTSFVNHAITTTRTGSRQVIKMDLSPDGSRLAIIGNFTSVDGASRPQLAVLDTSGAASSLANWQTNFYGGACAPVFDTYLRDLDIDPTGSYLVVSTTGAYGGPNSPCDVIARWDLTASGAGLNPVWRAYTGGDTTYAVVSTGAAVYAGGHMRWLNNPFAGDRAGPGAVPRQGIVALDPENGLPFSWNPGRERGVGVFDLLATADGLWVGSDTDRIGGELRRRIAFMPLAGGTVPDNVVGSLPNDVYQLGPASGGPAVLRRSLNAAGESGSTVTLPADLAWESSRGAFLVDDTLYSGWSDGAVYAQTFTADGVTGNRRALNLYNGSFGGEVSTVTGLAYAHGRIYYTRQGSNQLLWRAFTHESGIVGAASFVVGGTAAMQPNRVAGMFHAGGFLYFADNTSGDLLRVPLAGDSVTGTPELVNDTEDWRARSLMLWNAQQPPPPNELPTAQADAQCGTNSCSFTGSASDPDGQIGSYAWNFGDGATGFGPTVQHAYAAGGSYTATLTVTDDRGGTAQATVDVTVEDPPAPQLDFVAANSALTNATSVQVTAPGSVQEGDTLLLFVTANRDDATLGNPSGAGWSQVVAAADSTMLTRAWVKTATAADAGSGVRTSISATAKLDAQLLVYRGAAANPVTDATWRAEPASVAGHTTAGSADTPAGSRVVSYWADKTSATTSWTVPGSVTQRRQSIGGGSGRITSVSADAPSVGGAVPGVTATANSTGAKATMLTVVLRPA